MKEQDNNRRNTVRITYCGETYTISEWAKIKGINRSTLNNRIYRGMSIEKALSEVNFYGSSN